MEDTIEKKLGKMREEIERHDMKHSRSGVDRKQSTGPIERKKWMKWKNDKGFTFMQTDEPEDLATIRRGQRANTEYRERNIFGGDDDDEEDVAKPAAGAGGMKKNPKFAGAAFNNLVSDDDDVPVGFSSRRRRYSSNSSFHRRFENQVGKVAEEKSTKYAKSEKQVDPDPVDQKEIEQKRQEIQTRLIEHEQNLRQRREQIGIDLKHNQRKEEEEKVSPPSRKKSQHSHHHGQHRSPLHKHQRVPQHHAPPAQGYYEGGYPYYGNGYSSPPQAAYPNYPHYQPPQAPLPSYNPYMMNPMMMNPQAQQQQQQLMMQMMNPMFAQQQLQQQLQQPLQQQQNTADLSELKQKLAALKEENNTLKQKKEQKRNQPTSLIDQERLRLHKDQNAQLSRALEECKKSESDLQQRIQSLTANKQYLLSRATTLSMDIDSQDQQEEALNRQVNEFNKLIREKEDYMSQLLSEVEGLTEAKSYLSQEIMILAQKEEYLVNDLIAKEDQVGELRMQNGDLGQAVGTNNGSKYMKAENERLKKEIILLRDELQQLEAQKEALGRDQGAAGGRIDEREHEYTLVSGRVVQLESDVNTEKMRLQQAKLTLETQQRAFDELKTQMQVLQERSSKMTAMNEVLILQQQREHEELLKKLREEKQRQHDQEIRDQQRHLENIKRYQQDLNEIPSKIQRPPKHPEYEDEAEANVDDDIPAQKPIQTPARAEKSTIQQPPQVIPRSQRKTPPQPEEPPQPEATGLFMPDSRHPRAIKAIEASKREMEDSAKKASARSKKRIRFQEASPVRASIGKDTVQLRNHGGTMAGLLSWGEQEEPFLNSANRRHEKREAEKPLMVRGDDENVSSMSRSRSRSQAARIQEVMNWADEDTLKRQRLHASHNLPAPEDIKHRSLSAQRKHEEGRAIQNLMDGRVPPEESWQAIKRPPSIPREASPQDPLDIRMRNQGGNMSNLLQIEKEPSPVKQPQTTIKQYGKVSSIEVKKLQTRKEELDNYMLQLQIDKRKLQEEMERIGEYPKSVQALKRKEEIQKEVAGLGESLKTVKDKLKGIETALRL